MAGSILKRLNGFSYKEKSILISLLAVAGIYGGYFFDVIGGSAPQSLSGMLVTMFGIVVALVMVHVIFHIVITLDDVSEAEDERDRAVSRRAAVVGYNVLFVALLLITGRILILGAWAEEAGEVLAPSHVEIVNLLLAAMIASEVVYYAAQLLFYRRGVHG